MVLSMMKNTCYRHSTPSGLFYTYCFPRFARLFTFNPFGILMISVLFFRTSLRKLFVRLRDSAQGKLRGFTFNPFGILMIPVLFFCTSLRKLFVRLRDSAQGKLCGFTFNPKFTMQSRGIIIEKYLQTSMCLKNVTNIISGIYGKKAPKVKIVKYKTIIS